jgi:hypothetical protein
VSEEAKTIPNIDYLGRTYDVVTMDPLNLGTTSKNQNVIDISVQDGHTVHTRDGYYIVPAGVRHEAPFSMSYESASTVMSSSYEFQQEMKIAVSADAGIEGGFEFSASASSRDMERQTGSRKRTFVYSRAYQEDHILDLDFDNDKALLAVTPEFRDAVLALPYPDEMPDWQAKYDAFLERFGTHFTNGIRLGGLAWQRTSGLATAYLRSAESERTLETKAAVQLDAVKGGASAQVAVATASKTDQEYSLERTSLEFRGGHGSPTGINDQWLQSLRPTGDTAPLRYGEPVVMILPGRKTEEIGGLFDVAKGSRQIEFPQRNGEPFCPETMKAALRVLSGDGSNKNTVILAGDQVRIEIIDVGFFDRDMLLTKNRSDAGRFTILHHDDNLRTPGRLGEYFESSDRVAFLPAGATDRCLQMEARFVGSTRSIGFAPIPQDLSYSGFLLRRCAEREED